MKKHLVATTVIGALLLMGSIPCFADVGSGVTIPTTITVTGGSGSSGSSWSGGSYPNWHYVDNQPRKVSPYVPPVTNSYPPTQPTYSPPSDTPAVANPPVVESSSAINWGFALVIAIFAGAIGLLIYLVIKMRKKFNTKEVEQA